MRYFGLKKQKKVLNKEFVEKFREIAKLKFNIPGKAIPFPPGTGVMEILGLLDLRPPVFEMLYN